MKKNPIDYARLLMWSAAMVGVVRYSAAFIASDVGKIEGVLSEWITILLGFSGLGMGLLDTIGGMYLFDGWRKVMPRSGGAWPFRFKILTFFVFALFVTGIIILTPFTMSRVAHKSLVGILGEGIYLAVWSVLVNAAPPLLIGGVAVGHKLIADTQISVANEGANGSRTVRRTLGSLTNSEKYYILNNKSRTLADEFGVTPRAIQKWRLSIQDEVRQGKL